MKEIKEGINAVCWLLTAILFSNILLIVITLIVGN